MINKLNVTGGKNSVLRIAYTKYLKCSLTSVKVLAFSLRKILFSLKGSSLWCNSLKIPIQITYKCKSTAPKKNQTLFEIFSLYCHLRSCPTFLFMQKGNKNNYSDGWNPPFFNFKGFLVLHHFIFQLTYLAENAQSQKNLQKLISAVTIMTTDMNIEKSAISAIFHIIPNNIDIENWFLLIGLLLFL